MDTIRRNFRSAITAASANRLALTVTLILVIELNPARAFAQGTWTQTAPDPTPRWWSAASQFDGVITVAGGFSPTSGNLTTVESFPCDTDTGWCANPSLPNGPQTGAAAGTDFSQGLDSPTFEVAGGNNGSGPVATLSIMIAPFVFAAGPWPSMPTARENPANLLGSGLRLFVVGGNTSSGVTGALEVYNPETLPLNSWTSKAPMPTPRSNLGGANFYAIGGRDSSGAVLATNELYDLPSNTWTTKAPMPTPRADLAVAAFNGLIYAIGGRGADGSPLATVEVYDPATDTWTTAPPMPTARWGLVALAADFSGVSCGVCAPGPAIYAIGGALDAAGTVATGANEYFSLPTPTPTPTPTCGQVSVSPTNLSFEAGKRGKQTVKVTNTGPLNVNVISAEITNTIRKDFTVSEDKCARTTLASGGSCNVSVSFHKTIHQATGTLTITDTACDSPQTISLQDVNFK